MNDPPILLRRKIEALILKEVFDVTAERSGQQEAEAVIGTACSRAAIAHGQQMANKLDHAPDLSCNRGADFCKGYNPDMELTRTQTIMSGASHCDFRYRMARQDTD